MSLCTFRRTTERRSNTNSRQYACVANKTYDTIAMTLLRSRIRSRSTVLPHVQVSIAPLMKLENRFSRVKRLKSVLSAKSRR